jgi:preprotein translocase subunit YajC
MLISEAWAQTGGGGSGDIFVSLMPLILIFAVFYFLLIRPQQKRQKQHRESVTAAKKGDKILTGGGIYATVVKAVEGSEDVTVEIADGVRIRVARMTIQDVLTKPEAARPDAAKAGGKGGKQAGGGGDKDTAVQRESGLFNKLAGKKQQDG